MTVTINGTTGITTPDLESEGPISGTTGTFSGDLTLGSSTLATPTGSAPSYLCRAWVNFNGTGTVAIRGSGNVSSITDNGTGDYTVNFTTAMPDANYATTVSVGNDNTGNSGFRGGALLTTMTAPTSSAVRVGSSVISSGTNRVVDDNTHVLVSIFR